MAGTISSIIPRLPSRNLETTRRFYTENLGFKQVGHTYPDYLMLSRDGFELHFFRFQDLDVLKNYGMCYIRVKDLRHLYDEFKASIPSLKQIDRKPWGQSEFYVTDEDHNVLAFGEATV
jgi:catechol 2,3-dioxygenase-like lactoylglutathione lyase family enzyme